MKNFMLLFIIWAWGFPSRICAQNQPSRPIYTGTVFTGGERTRGIDTLEIFYHRPYTPKRTKYETFTVMTDSMGNFSFKLPAFKEPAPMWFFLKRNGKAITDMARKRYFFESTDRIHINIEKNSNQFNSFFSGNGSEKYIVVSKLSGLGSPSEVGTLLRLGMGKLALDQPDSLETKLVKLNALVDEIIGIKDSILRTANLLPRFQKMIGMENAPIDADWRFRLVNLYTGVYKNDPAMRKIIKENYLLNRDKYSLSVEEDMALCPMYLDQLAKHNAYDLLMEAPDDSITFEAFYQQITSKYSGLVRERLVANLFLAFSGRIAQMSFDNRIVDSLMVDGARYINEPFIRKIYTAQERLNIGRPVFNGRFKDQQGKVVDLVSLRGKVIFIDLWFTGCGACARFHTEFHGEFYGLLKSREDFVYLSIGTDRDVKTWIQSIPFNKYTATDYLNVHAHGGLNHAFAKYYDIGGAPFILLIGKDGNIFANAMDGAKGAYNSILKALGD